MIRSRLERRLRFVRSTRLEREDGWIFRVNDFGESESASRARMERHLADLLALRSSSTVVHLGDVGDGLRDYSSANFVRFDQKRAGVDCAFFDQSIMFHPLRNGLSLLASALEPGGLVAGYLWMMSDRFDVEDFEASSDFQIMLDACDIPTSRDIRSLVQRCGLEVLHIEDMQCGAFRPIFDEPSTQKRLRRHVSNVVADAMIRRGNAGDFQPLTSVLLRKISTSE